MCGILTVIQKAGPPLDPSACRRALSHLSWRGPDLSASVVWKDRVFIGHNVLSLTGDVRARKTIYSTSNSGRYRIAFNGEIYNYRELARRWLQGRLDLTDDTSDTEVLVNLHDVLPAAEIPDLLDGMFAYSVLDEIEGVLHVARDVQGEKSLYIYENDFIIVIASEISAIQSLVPGIQLDKQALRDYFRTRHFMLFSRTCYRGIRQILPGRLERLTIIGTQWTTVASRTIGDWIDPARMDDNARRSLDSLADELDAILVESIRQMVPRSQPYAAVVSGGVDSSLLSHYLVAYGNPQVLVAVNNIGKDLISSDLSGFEQSLKRNIEVLQIDKTAYAAELVRCQEKCRGPLLSHSFVAQSMQSAFIQSTGCRILFGGEGGDEYFGGYDAYLRNSDAIGTAGYSPSPYLTLVTPEIDFLDDDPSEIQRSLSEAWSAAQAAYASVGNRTDRTSLAMMYGDAAYQLPAVGLRCADLMSMMWSVETRSALLRRAVATFALNLPMAARIDHTAASPNNRTKILLKKLFLRYYPESLLVEKQGFAGFPNESADYLGALEDYMVFDELGIKRPSSPEQCGRATLWKLANLEYFLRARQI